MESNCFVRALDEMKPVAALHIASMRFVCFYWSQSKTILWGVRIDIVCIQPIFIHILHYTCSVFRFTVHMVHKHNACAHSCELWNAYACCLIKRCKNYQLDNPIFEYQKTTRNIVFPGKPENIRNICFNFESSQQTFQIPKGSWQAVPNLVIETLASVFPIDSD